MKDYEIKKDEYKETWDKRKEFDSFEVACLSCNVTPSNYDKTEDKVKEKIDGMKGILDEINREREYKMKITIKERGGDPFCNIPASSFYFSRLQLHSPSRYFCYRLQREISNWNLNMTKTFSLVKKELNGKI